jgi:small subunit ribosomal protein S3
MSAVRYFIGQNTRKLQIDEFLMRELNSAGYGGVDIRKMPMRTELTIHASRPGVVIGRRGSKIRELTAILEEEFGVENAQLEVNEIENPWLNAFVMASRLARQLERGVRFRRMAYWILRRVMRAGAVGCEIIVKGKLSSRRARYQKFKKGTISKTGEPSKLYVDEADDRAVLKPGVIGIKVRIMRPEAKLPGIIHVKEPEPKEVVLPDVRVEPEEAAEEVAEEEQAKVEEALEGITDIEELRELEELDGLELVDEIEEVPPKEPETTETTEEDTKPEEKKPDEEDDETTKALEELEELENLDVEGE